MKFKKISIIGLGLIGGSLARSLKKSGSVDWIVGIDTDSSTLKYAIEEGIVDEAVSEVDSRIQDSDIVILATYVNTIPSIASRLVVSEDTLVTDVGSVKETIVREIGSSCGFSFIGSHPISGSEKSGITGSDGNLFAGKLCIITPTNRNTPKDISTIKEFWSITGSTVIEMEPQTHDKIFAYVSHLPHAVAFSLINSFQNNQVYLQYAGGGLHDFTRIAESSPEMWTEIFLLNRKHLLEVIERYNESLQKLTELIENNDRDGLRKYLNNTVNVKRQSKSMS